MNPAPSNPAADAPPHSARRTIGFLCLLLALMAYPTYYVIRDAIRSPYVDRGNYVEVDLQRLGAFPFNAESSTINDIPADIRALHGKRVVLVGEIVPGEAGKAVREFDLVYSIANCCFSGTPQIQHFVHATSLTAVANHPRPVKATGTLTVDLKRKDGRTTSVFQLAVESVEPL